MTRRPCRVSDLLVRCKSSTLAVEQSHSSCLVFSYFVRRLVLDELAHFPAPSAVINPTIATIISPLVLSASKPASFSPDLAGGSKVTIRIDRQSCGRWEEPNGDLRIADYGRTGPCKLGRMEACKPIGSPCHDPRMFSQSARRLMLGVESRTQRYPSVGLHRAQFT